MSRHTAPHAHTQATIMTAATALVVATYSRRMQLQMPDGRKVDARIKGKRIKPVCGDRVEAEPIADEPDWLITAICDRRNQLTRPNLRGKVEVLAANIDRLVVMAAPSPEPDWSIVDRYLCAAELIHASAAVVFNRATCTAASPSTRFSRITHASATRLSAAARSPGRISRPSLPCSMTACRSSWASRALENRASSIDCCGMNGSASRRSRTRAAKGVTPP